MGASYKINDSIVFKSIDETLANLDIKDLMKAKLELMKEGKDTSIIDKAIKERKSRDKVIKKNNERIINQERKMNKMKRRALLLGLIDGLSSGIKSKDTQNDLMSWEEDAIKNDGYESHNFEEEELEEDDYYFEDEK